MDSAVAVSRGPAGRVIFIGAVHEAYPALGAVCAFDEVEVAAVVTSSCAGALRQSGAVDLEPLAQQAGAPLLRTDDVNDPSFVHCLRELEPDLLVVVGWTRLIGRPLLAVPRHGCIGFHASLLPKNRGRAPVNWSILRGERTTGNTMMMLDPGADTGDIVDQRGTEIGPDDTCATVYGRVAELGAQMLREHMPALLVGCAPRRPQELPSGDPLPRRTPDMGVIDWNRAAREVHDWVRALTLPYPGAFSRLSGRTVMIWGTRPPSDSAPAGEPGRVLGCGANGLRVGTRGGSIVVTHVSEPGQAPAPAIEWCTANGVTQADRFDSAPPAVVRWVRGEGPRPKETQLTASST